MGDMLTIRETVARANTEGLRLSEYTLRRWIRTGQLPARSTGRKMLLFYPNVMNFIRCADGQDNLPPPQPVGGIRPVDCR